MLRQDVAQFGAIFLCFFASFFCVLSIVMTSLNPFEGSTHINNVIFQLLTRSTYNPDEPLQTIELPGMSIDIHQVANTTWPIGEAQDDPILPGVMYIIVLVWIIIGGIGTPLHTSPLAAPLGLLDELRAPIRYRVGVRVPGEFLGARLG